MKYLEEIRHFKVSFASLLLVSCLLMVVACGGSSSENGQPPDDGNGASGSPTLTLSDGTVVVLERSELVQELREQFPIPPETAPEENEGGPNAQTLPSTNLLPQQVPARVDLSALQTPIRHQGGRGTCVAHATAAALEAAYKRERGLTLDLSEQYANHIQKSVYLRREAAQDPNKSETFLGAWGGSGVGYQLGWLFRLQFGLPLESSTVGIVAGTPDWSDLSYIPWSTYENTNQTGDAPRLSSSDETLEQRVVDAWNLNSEPTTYQIPDTVTLTNLPRNALNEAVYGVSRVRSVERSLEGIKGELAAGREVAFGVSLTRPNPCEATDEAGNVTPLPEGDACYDIQDRETDGAYRGGIWRPLNSEAGGHAMLIVGYDDARRVFIVKNSWGRDESGRGRPAEADPDADGFIEMSYDWLPRIYETYSILETRDPDRWNNQQPFLGKWHLETDTELERADLAAYHLPYAFPRDALGGQTDRRIGTLYDESRAYRVNGFIGGDLVRAYFGDARIDSSYERITVGTEIRARRIGNSLAGWAEPYANPDAREPFFATLADYPEMQAARSGAIATPAPLDFFGKWAIKGAGLNGVLEFDRSITSGTYTAAGGSVTSGVTLERNPRTVITDPDDPCFIRITVPLSNPVVLDGLLFCETSSPAKRALITGITDEGAFYAYRQKLAPGLEIRSPTDGSSTPRRRQRVEFRATTTGFAEAPVIRWESDVDGTLGESSELISKLDLSFGEHTITATTANPAGGTLRDSVNITITNDPPSIDILEPTSAGPFCVGETITFRASAQDLNNEGNALPDDAVTWRVPGVTLGRGKTITYGFVAGEYTVVARAVDSEGASAEDSLTLNFIDCEGNTAPEAQITSPAADTETNDDRFAYDGFDDMRAQWYKDVTLTGMGSDAEDGDLMGDALVWTTNRSDLQTAELGSGNSLSVRLYSDTCTGVWHDITLSVTDSNGESRSVIRRIFIWTLC